MNPTAIFWAMIAHALLVFIVYGILSYRRRGAVARGEAKAGQFKGRRDEPSSSETAANNILNQFEAPILFHIVCICLFVTAGVNLVTVVLAWVFALSRYLHAFVHLTSNRMRLRFPLFALGIVVLFLLWLFFALHLAGI